MKTQQELIDHYANMAVGCHAYIREISQDAVVSTSHYTLRELYRRYGQTDVDEFVMSYFAAKWRKLS